MCLLLMWFVVAGGFSFLHEFFPALDSGPSARGTRAQPTCMFLMSKMWFCYQIDIRSRNVIRRGTGNPLRRNGKLKLT